MMKLAYLLIPALAFLVIGDLIALPRQAHAQPTEFGPIANLSIVGHGQQGYPR